MKTSLKTLLLLAASFSIGFGMEEGPDSRKNPNAQQITQGIELGEIRKKIVPINETSLKLDLCHNNIDSKGASNLGESLSKLQNLTSLKVNLGHTNIGNEGASNLGESLAKLRNLTSLMLYLDYTNIGNNNSLSDTLISLVSEGRLRNYALVGLPPKLHELLKEWIERKKLLPFLLEALKQRKEILQEIAADFLLPATYEVKKDIPPL